MNKPFIKVKKPDGYDPYLVFFKNDDIHPFDKVEMMGRAVRILAPNVDAAMEIIEHRFGTSYAKVSPEYDLKYAFYPNGIWETLVYQNVVK